MKVAIVAYLATGVAMLGADAVWLTLTADRLYRAHLGDMLMPGYALTPAALFYFLYVFGVVVLVVMPAIAARRIAAVPVRGGLLGLVAYATYDLTNQATLRGWSQTVTIADLCWGTILTAFAATVGALVTRAVAARR